MRSNAYPNLIEITTFGDPEPVYIKGQWVLDSDLTDDEKVVLERSKYYLMERLR